jgi:hypothetical protein
MSMAAVFIIIRGPRMEVKDCDGTRVQRPCCGPISTTSRQTPGKQPTHSRVPTFGTRIFDADEYWHDSLGRFRLAARPLSIRSADKRGEQSHSNASPAGRLCDIDAYFGRTGIDLAAGDAAQCDHLAVDSRWRAISRHLGRWAASQRSQSGAAIWNVALPVAMPSR